MQNVTISAMLDERPPAAEDGDYALVRAALSHISVHYREQPEVEAIAEAVGTSPARLTQLLRQWCGLTPKAFLQAVTLDHARRLLAQERAPVLEAALDLGLSGPSRLHDLFVTHEAVPPGHFRAQGEGLILTYGFHPSPFGTALIMVSEWGLAGLAFADEDRDGRQGALDDMIRRWPKARFIEDPSRTAPLVARIFKPEEWKADRPLRVVMIGSDFDVTVWEGLLSIPLGGATSYGSLAARLGKPKAARAIGAAVGRNPLSFVVPCHRVMGANGALTGYHWGLTRKRAMLGWEAGVGAV